MKNSEPKKIIGIQVEQRLADALTDLAAEYGTNLSSVVRMIVLDYLRRYKNYKAKNEKGDSTNE